MTDQLIIEVYRSAATGKPQVTIGTLSEDGTADLYRLAGPAFIGTDRNLLSKPLDEHDAAEIRRYLDAVFPVPVPESGEFAVRCFEVEDGSSVSLACPDCGDPMPLTSDEAPTLGDVILAAAAHLCEEWDSEDSAAAHEDEEAASGGGTEATP